SADGIYKICAVGGDATSQWQTYALATSTTWTKAIPTTLSVVGRYSGGSNWNAYVKAAATTTACDGTETGGYTACLHGGEYRKVSVSAIATCTGYTGVDKLSVFDWTCDDSGSPVVYYGSLKSTKGLTDLVDATAWKSNTFRVKTSNTIVDSSPLGVWHTNTVQALSTAAGAGAISLSVANVVHTISADITTGRGYSIDADGVSIVALGNYTVTGAAVMASNNCRLTTGETASANGKCVVFTGSQKFLWLEAKFAGAGTTQYNRVALLASTQFSRLHNFTGSSCSVSGCNNIDFYSSNFNKLTNITSKSCYAASGVFCTNLNFTTNSGYNTVSSVDASGSTVNDGYMVAVSLTQSTYNSVDGITMNNITLPDTARIYGVRATTLSTNNTFKNIDVSSNTCSATGNIYGVYALNNSTSGKYINVSVTNNTCTAGVSGITGAFMQNAATQSTVYNMQVTGNSAGGTNASINGYYTQDTSSYFIKTLVANNTMTTTGGAIYAYNANWSAGNDRNTMAFVTFRQNSNNFANLGLGAISNFAAYHTYLNMVSAQNTGAGVNGGRSFVYNGVNATNNYAGHLAWGDVNSDGILVGNNSDNNTFFGPLLGGLRSTGSDCLLSSAGANPGIVTSTCAAQGPSTSVFSAIGTLASAFVGVTDHRLSASDNILRNTIGNGSANGAWTDGALCPAIVDGNVAITNLNATPITFLKNAMEAMDDGIGNDNGLCESSETCIYAPNFGYYQGEGTLSGTCSFNDGTVTGVTLRRYLTNGG
ncbi:MAG: hypothetical protein ACOYOK_11220, partial [Pseudobdellovibrionaceae bacterium]